ncbi:GntR family transcriptional regulator [Aneurinibacillus sp. XH2]|uniref:MocR-like pyridoxine biosynthesis transcription factor PdxR n=1 Tax=Aneurinibacillus sp. XH2 TaxID=1450761 RepID=UPI0007091B08|nr:PLP-dependent aminotransferase family protein [Aneurinibacillus sp. XH2]AMA73139.1 GntR family transcriptional regulator [Aneurinibacillus sp. XH2]
MQIKVNRQLPVPLAKQIYQAIVDRIQSELLEEGTRLPSVRALAKQIHVSFMTVVQAYDALEEDGYIIRIQGKGTFVRTKAADTTPKKELPKKESPFDWQLSVPDYLPRAQFSRYHQVSARYEFFSSTIDPGLLPNRYLEKEIQRILAEEPRILSTYSDVQGDLPLRQELTVYLRDKQIQVTPEEILITNGTQQGIDLVARTFVGPGDIVITEAPTYPAAIDVFRWRGATILPVPVDKDGMRVDMLAALCEKYKPKLIYTMPTFHNPTGTVMSIERRRQLLDIAYETQSIILEDDPWSEIYYENKPPSSLKSMDPLGHVIYLKGLSKILAPGCRIGVLVASGTIFHRLVAAKGNMDLGSPLLTQKAVLPLLYSERMRNHVKKLRIALQLRRDMMIELLAKHMPEGISWLTPRGGVNLWLSLPPHVDTEDFLMYASNYQLTFLPGAACYPIESKHHFLRLSFSFMNEPLLAEGVKELCRATGAFIEATVTYRKTPVV